MQFIAISESGIAAAFKFEPTFMHEYTNRETGAREPGRWFDYHARDEGHIVALFDLRGIDPATTLIDLGEQDGRFEHGTGF